MKVVDADDVKHIAHKNMESAEALLKRYPTGMAFRLGLPDGLPNSVLEVFAHVIEGLPPEERKLAAQKLWAAGRMLVDCVCGEIADQFFVLANQEAVRRDTAKSLEEGKALAIDVPRPGEGEILAEFLDEEKPS